MSDSEVHLTPCLVSEDYKTMNKFIKKVTKNTLKNNKIESKLNKIITTILADGSHFLTLLKKTTTLPNRKEKSMIYVLIKNN